MAKVYKTPSTPMAKPDSSMDGDSSMHLSVENGATSHVSKSSKMFTKAFAKASSVVRVAGASTLSRDENLGLPTPENNRPVQR
jgi:hypothetical protein